MDIYRKRADRMGGEELVFSTEANDFASDLSTDGRYVLYDFHETGGTADVRYLESRPDGGFEAKPFVSTEFDEKAAKISPSGDWVAYVSDESGRYEIYIQRFPDGGDQRRISEYGGVGPRWSRDGSRLYYVQEDTLMEVDLQLDANSVAVSPPNPLFQAPGLDGEGSAYPHYDVADNGERFVVRDPLGNSKVRVVQNWFAEFQDREQE